MSHRCHVRPVVHSTSFVIRLISRITCGSPTERKGAKNLDPACAASSQTWAARLPPYPWLLLLLLSLSLLLSAVAVVQNASFANPIFNASFDFTGQPVVRIRNAFWYLWIEKVKIREDCNSFQQYRLVCFPMKSRVGTCVRTALRKQHVHKQHYAGSRAVWCNRPTRLYWSTLHRHPSLELHPF